MSNLPTEERVIDYETREIKEIFVECHKCSSKVKRHLAHPITLPSDEVALCTDCCNDVFGYTPAETIDDIEEESQPNVLISVLLALRQAHAEYISLMVTNLNGDMGSRLGEPDPISGIFMLLAYLGLLCAILGVIIGITAPVW